MYDCVTLWLLLNSGFTWQNQVAQIVLHMPKDKWIKVEVE